MLKLMLLLHRRPDLTPEEFRRYWHDQHQALLRRLPGLRRLVLNDPLPTADGAPAACDGIAEDWFDSPEALQAALASPEGQTVAAGGRGAARRGGSGTLGMCAAPLRLSMSRSRSRWPPRPSGCGRPCPTP